MSKTFTSILTYWNESFPEGISKIDLPFNIEKFCRENDQLIEQTNKNYKIGELLVSLIQSGEYGELTFNHHGEKGIVEISGYNGYEAFRESDIEDTDIAKELMRLLNESN